MPGFQLLSRAGVAIIGWAVGEPLGLGRQVRLVVLEIDHPFEPQEFQGPREGSLEIERIGDENVDKTTPQLFGELL